MVNGVTCTTDQIVRHDGNAWKCVDDPFAGLNCTAGDQLRFTSGGWECSAEPITASLSNYSWNDLMSEDLPIGDYFVDSLINVETDSRCASGYCNIRVIGVADHRSCSVAVFGDATAKLEEYVEVNKSVTEISVGLNYAWVWGESAYINIFCMP